MRGRAGPGKTFVSARRAGTLLLVLLATSTIAAIVAGQALRREGTVFAGTTVINCARFEFMDDKACVGLRPREVNPGDADLAICFKPNVNDRVRIALLDRDQAPVRILAKGIAAHDGQRRCLIWNGRNQAGEAMVADRYRLQLSFDKADRVALAGEPIKLPRRRAEG